MARKVSSLIKRAGAAKRQEELSPLNALDAGLICARLEVMMYACHMSRPKSLPGDGWMPYRNIVIRSGMASR